MKLRPGVEAMERRTLLTAALAGAGQLARVAAVAPIEATAKRPTPAENRIYLSELIKAFTPQGVAPETQTVLLRMLDTGRSRTDVVRTFLRTPEVATTVVNFGYKTLLNRPPTAAEKALAIAEFRNGADPRRIYSRLIGSPEYVRLRSGGTTAGLVTTLYHDVLGRAPDAKGVAFWTARLEAGVSPAKAARTLISSREAISRFVHDTLMYLPDADEYAKDPAYLRLALTPGGLAKVAAKGYGSDEYFSLLTTPVAPTPPATASPTFHPPGLPMFTQFDLGSRWTKVTTANSPGFNGTNLVSAASDGTIWATSGVGVGTQNQVYLFASSAVTNTPKWVALPTLANPLVSISAVSANLAWGVMSYSDGNHLVTIDGTGVVTDKGLNAGNPATSVSAAADGTYATLNQDGTTSIYFPGQSTPTIVSVTGFEIGTITVGSASNIWATGIVSGTTNYVVMHLVNNLWKVDQAVANDGLFFISATADGSVWAWNAVTIFLRPATTGVWGEVGSKIQVPPDALVAGGAISQYRIFFGLGDNTFRILSVGVVDQQAVPYPAMNANQLAGYNAISAYLGAVSANGIRGDYSNGNLKTNLLSDPGLLAAMPQPSNVPNADWTLIKNQVLTELKYVGDVFNLFDRLNKVTDAVEANIAITLPGIKSLVGTSDQVNSSDVVTLFLEGWFEAILWGAAAAGGAVSPAFGVVASMLASGFGSVASVFTNTPNPDSNTQLDITYFNLTQTLQGAFAAIDTKNGGYEQAILNDWGKLNAVGAAINSKTNPWNWPDGTAKMIGDAMTPSFNYFFFQTLMPAKWQVVYYPYHILNDQDPPWGYYRQPNLPAYDLISKFITNTLPNGYNDPVYSYRFINQVGASTDLHSNNGPLPTQALLNAIYALGVTQDTLFSATDGWSLNVIQENF